MLALIAILPLLFTASATPIEKRFNRALIVSGRNGQCLVAAPKTGVGSQVYTDNCDTTTGAKFWDINPGSGSVILSGTNLALDAGSNPGNFGTLKVWTSYPGLYQQTWYLTGDNRIAITGGNQCLDEGDNGPQTYQCTTGNTNQVWNVKSGGQPSSSSQAPPSSSSSKPPASSSSVPPATGKRIKWNTDSTDCLTVMNGYAGDGAVVRLTKCFTDDDPYAKFQRFDAPNGRGLVRLSGTNYCLDAGTNPHDGVDMKIWTCYDGLYQQEWTYTNGNIKLDNNQCVDIRMDSGPNPTKPYGSIKDAQTWTCYAGNTNQQFTFA